MPVGLFYIPPRDHTTSIILVTLRACAGAQYPVNRCGMDKEVCTRDGENAGCGAEMKHGGSWQPFVLWFLGSAFSSLFQHRLKLPEPLGTPNVVLQVPYRRDPFLYPPPPPAQALPCLGTANVGYGGAVVRVQCGALTKFRDPPRGSPLTPAFQRGTNLSDL